LPDRTERERVIARSARLGALAELQGIRLHSLTLQSGPEASGPPYDLGIVINPSVDVKGSKLHYEVKYKVSAKKQDTSVLALDCTYQISYNIPEDARAEQDEIEAFGSTIVLFTIHPYLRELVSNISARTGLPPIMLGVMRLPLEISEILTGELNIQEAPPS
jgi:preprotein translocase subunit SecB